MNKVFPSIVLLLVVFLSACKRDHRVIEKAMRNISSQTAYITAPAETAPSPWWPFAVVFGLVFLILIVLAAIYTHHNKQQQQKATAKPARKRRVTKVYLPPVTPGQAQPQNTLYATRLPQHPEYEYEEHA